MNGNSLKKNSAFEFMRILAMILIIGCHYAGHGIEQMLWVSSNKHNVWLAGDLYKQIFTSLLIPGGEVGVGLFFVLTGFFMIEKEIKPIKVMKLLFEVFFYACLSILIFCFTYFFQYYSYPELTLSSKLALINVLFIPITSCSWWFISAYLLLYILIPGINKIILKLNKKGFLIVLLLIYIFWYGPCIFNFPFSMLQKALFFYLLGAFIKLYIAKKEKSVLSKTRLISVMILIVSLILMAMLELYISKGIDLVGKMKLLALTARFILSFILVPLSVFFIFELFQNISIKYNKVINMVSSTTLGVYLLHDSIIMRPLLWNKIINALAQYQSDYYIFKSICSILFVFVICALIDFFRMKFIEPLFDPLYGLVTKKISDFTRV